MSSSGQVCRPEFWDTKGSGDGTTAATGVGGDGPRGEGSVHRHYRTRVEAVTPILEDQATQRGNGHAVSRQGLVLPLRIFCMPGAENDRRTKPARHRSEQSRSGKVMKPSHSASHIHLPRAGDG